MEAGRALHSGAAPQRVAGGRAGAAGFAFHSGFTIRECPLADSHGDEFYAVGGTVLAAETLFITPAGRGDRSDAPLADRSVAPPVCLGAARALGVACAGFAGGCGATTELAESRASGAPALLGGVFLVATRDAGVHHYKVDVRTGRLQGGSGFARLAIPNWADISFEQKLEGFHYRAYSYQ